MALVAAVLAIASIGPSTALAADRGSLRVYGDVSGGSSSNRAGAQALLPLSSTNVPDGWLLAATSSAPAASTSQDTAAQPPSRSPAAAVHRVSQSVHAELAALAPPFLDADQLSMEIDGRLDESVWQQAVRQRRMVVLEPDTLEEPRHATETRMFYTQRGLYVGVLNEQPNDLLIPRLSSRDRMDINRDQVGVTLDTSGQGLFGYWFMVNLGDSLNDGTVLPERQFRNEWDGPWRGASSVTDDGWSAEFFIPWTMMAMPDAPDQRTMGVYVSRKVAYLDERWGWPALPQTSPRFMSALQPLTFERVSPGQQLTFYPFVSQTFDGVDHEARPKLGADFFWRPTTNFQITATANPDFGQVEADDVVVNLTAFETFFPEKRPFFLEGYEIFVAGPRGETRGRGEPTTLVNTRRIGARPLPLVIPAGVTVANRELARPTELLGAAKVTGQFGSFRYGLLSAFEDDANLLGRRTDGQRVPLQQDGREFAVGRLLYESTSGGTYSGIGWLGTLVNHPAREALVNGLDFHYLSDRGAWKWDAQLIYSDVTDQRDGYGAFLDLTHVPARGVSHRLGLDYFDKNLDFSDLGFVRRSDSINFRYSFGLIENNVWFLRTRETEVFLSQDFAESDHRVARSGIFLRNIWTFNDFSKLYLEYDFFPPRWDDRNSRGNGDYRIEERNVLQAEYESDSTKRFGYALLLGFKNEDLGGNTFTYGAFLNARPFDGMSINLGMDYVDHGDWLIYRSGRDLATYDADEYLPKLEFDYFISAKQQLRLAFQWVAIQANVTDYYRVPIDDGDLERRMPSATNDEDFTVSNLTVQLRYRWEIAPLSDLFVVYTKNGNRVGMTGELSDLFADSYNDPINEQLVLKLRYRLGN